ncbi:MAG: hypothetical protein LBB46_02915 [Coriobacteriaceae bacterium]|jgi:hypothetical protein|nr:hypothetical protein [Coriobacteriaceae bacterium]
MPHALVQKPIDQTRNDYRKSLVDSLNNRLAKHDLSLLGPPEALVDRMIAALPVAGAAWSSAVGPVYTSQGLQKWLGVSRQAISQKAKCWDLLRLETADGEFVFPSFQFNDSGQRLPRLKDVLCELAKGTEDAWVWAAWLNAPDKDGITHAAKLRRGDWESVRDLACEDAAAWSGQ